MNKYIKALVKVTSKKEYAEDFRNGNLWMNELRFFRNCEDSEMGDQKEARSGTSKYGYTTVNYFELSDLCRPVFCLYGVYDTKHGNTEFVSLPLKMKTFGKYAVIVTDVEKFLERIQSKDLECGPVKYEKMDISNKDYKTPYKPCFHKDDYFRYQSEFRLLHKSLLLTGNSEEKYEGWTTLDETHFLCSIDGGLSDITSEVIDIDKLLNPNRFRVHLSVNWDKLKYKDFVQYENPIIKNRNKKVFNDADEYNVKKIR